VEDVKMTRIMIGLLMITLLIGTVGAVCEKETTNLLVNLNKYNTTGMAYINSYENGHKESACGALNDVGDVFRAYSDLSECYYKAGNRSLALEYVAKMEEWGEKDIDWENKCGLTKPDENRAKIYWIYASFYQDFKRHDCSTHNISATGCYSYHSEFDEKSCYYCKECLKLTPNRKLDCVLGYGCPAEDTLSDSSSNTGNNEEGSFPIIPVAIGVLVLILALAFFLLKGKKRKS
jgi:hypothetical protein